MNKRIYGKMAITNIFKNGKIYFPYLITIIGSMMFYFLLNSIGSNPRIYNVVTGVEAFKGASTLCGILQSGSFLSSVFIFIFLLYANSFVLKHQKKQLGLYRILGMEHKHMIKIIFTEVVFLFGVGIVAGLFFGIVLDKLMLVLLFKIIGQTAPAGFYLNMNAVIQTPILALVLAGLILVFNVFSMLRTKDIDLLKSEKVGEKEPKNRPIYTMVGVVALGIGYYIALKTTNAGSAINNFFPAALMVMYATYVLFISGSISVLKLLKSNKNYYYKTRHFISVSGMLYRMKQNAAGLATICILSTAAIIVISAGVSLYANGERGIQEQFPREVQFCVQMEKGEEAEALLQKVVAEQNFPARDMVRCTFGSSLFVKTENGIESPKVVEFTGFDNMPDCYILMLEEYNRFNGSNETLAENEILLYSSDGFYTNDTLTYADITYWIKGEADKGCLTYITNSTMSLFSKLLIVVSSQEVFDKFMVDSPESVGTWIGFDCDQNVEEQVSFAENGVEAEAMIKQQEQDTFYSMYGGILFVGGILGVLFILCTVMIIYYKQISEGFEDKERFHIMQKVGLSKEEIKSVIHSQIMLVFFLPLITAVIHSAVALKIVASCLRMVETVHMPTFILSVAATCLVFSIVYVIVYKITSKEYYNIVNA